MERPIYNYGSNVPRTHPYINKVQKKSDLLHDRSEGILVDNCTKVEVTFVNNLRH